MSIVIISVLAGCAVLAPILAPHDPTSIHMSRARLPPGADWAYPLGTDVLGRDILSRLIFGARSTMFISLVALGSGAVLGTTIGLIAGYFGGAVDKLAMRAADAVNGFPNILVAAVVVVILGTGTATIVAAVSLTVWARFARMIRGDVLSIKEMDYVTAARIAGLSPFAIIRRHIFPGTINTLMVITSLMMGQVILLEASLGFLALGLPPGAPAWGIMVAEGRDVIVDMWWLSVLPGIAISAVVLAFNFFGDWLRDALDPKLRRVR